MFIKKDKNKKISAVEAFGYHVSLFQFLGMVVISDPQKNYEKILTDTIDKLEETLDKMITNVIGFDQEGLEDRTIDGFVKFFANTKID